MSPGYQPDLFPVTPGDALLFVPAALPREADHEAPVSFREAENPAPAPAAIPMGAPKSPAVVQIWSSDEKLYMSDAAVVATVAEPGEGVGSPISPDMCGFKLRRPYMPVTSVCAPLMPGPASVHLAHAHFLERQGWVICTHPDGGVYLYHHTGQTVVEHPEGDEDLDAFIALITAKMIRLRLELQNNCESSDYELFLRVDPESQEVLYYFLDWEGRSVFWVHPYTLERPFASLSQLGHIRELQFWEHVERFPSHRTLPKGSLEELQMLLGYQVIDVRTNALSTAPYSSSDTATFLTCLESARCQTIEGINGPISAIVARLWVEQCRVRVHHFHGSPQARTERTERRGMKPLRAPHHWYQAAGLLLLFNEPYNFYRSLLDIFADEVIYERSWRAFYQDTLREEWKDHATMSTVSLAANMAFLTVGNVGGSISGNVLSPTSQVLSLCSTVLSIGSIVIGKSLPNFHRRMQNCSAIDAAQYMTSFSKGHRDGLYKLAMLFSLPFALFMWSLALFVAALFSFAFEHWFFATGIPVALISFGILGLLVMSLVFLRAGGGQFFITSDVSGPQPSGWRQFLPGTERMSRRLRGSMIRAMWAWKNAGNQRAESPESQITVVDEAPGDQQLSEISTTTRDQSGEEIV